MAPTCHTKGMIKEVDDIAADDKLRFNLNFIFLPAAVNTTLVSLFARRNSISIHRQTRIPDFQFKLIWDKLVAANKLCTLLYGNLFTIQNVIAARGLKLELLNNMLKGKREFSHINIPSFSHGIIESIFVTNHKTRESFLRFGCLFLNHHTLYLIFSEFVAQ